MQQINDFISYFKNMNQEKITDIAIAVGIVIIFWIVSSLFSYLVIRIFKFKEKNKKTMVNLNDKLTFFFKEHKL